MARIYSDTGENIERAVVTCRFDTDLFNKSIMDFSMDKIIVGTYGDEEITRGGIFRVADPCIKERAMFEYELPSTERTSLELGQVLSYEPALRLLAELYDEASIQVDAIKENCDEEMTISVGILAAAGLCSVSPTSIRLSRKGREFAECFIE